jgi:hypothetical protein
MFKYPSNWRRLGAVAPLKAIWVFGWAGVSGAAIIALLGLGIGSLLQLLGLR